MKTKTVRLDNNKYRLSGDQLQNLRWNDASNDYEWRPSWIQVGVDAILCSTTDVSPNALRDGRSRPVFSLRRNSEGGIGGNSNPSIARYHGWRGTTDDSSFEAHGSRRILKITVGQRGVSVTVGTDLLPNAK